MKIRELIIGFTGEDRISNHISYQYRKCIEQLITRLAIEQLRRHVRVLKSSLRLIAQKIDLIYHILINFNCKIFFLEGTLSKL